MSVHTTADKGEEGGPHGPAHLIDDRHVRTTVRSEGSAIKLPAKPIPVHILIQHAVDIWQDGCMFLAARLTFVTREIDE